jgi:hypothetical protein
MIMFKTLPFSNALGKVILAFTFLFLLPISSQAITLELHSGQIIEGKVILKEEDSYKLDTGLGFPVTYFIDEIKKIDEKPVSSITADDQQAIIPTEPLEATDVPMFPSEPETLDEPKTAAGTELGKAPKPHVMQEPEAGEGPSAEETQDIVDLIGTVEDVPILPSEPESPDEPKPAAGGTEPGETPKPHVIQEQEAGEGPGGEETQGIVNLEDIVAVEIEPKEKLEPMAELIAGEISQMMIKNNAASDQAKPVLREEPDNDPLNEPARDVLAVEADQTMKEYPSPFGPTIKPRESRSEVNDLDVGKRQEHELIAEIMQDPKVDHSATPPIVSNGKNTNAIFRAVDDFIYMQKLRLRFAQIEFQKNAPHIKEKLYQLPVRVRKDVLVILLCMFVITYIFVCYPLMNIARKMGKKHSWLIWIPFVQLVYYIYMAGKPLWWCIYWLIPIVNYFMLLLLFVDILKVMKKSFWLIVLIIIPGVNIFVLWYLAISQELEFKSVRVG